MFTLELKHILSAPNQNSKEVTELARKYKRAKTEEKRQYYKAKVIENTLKLAYKFCQPTLRFGKEAFEDHFQLAIVGILEALERFDEKKNFMFSTYATFWMRNYTSVHYHEMHTIKHPRDSYIGARKYENIINESIADGNDIKLVLKKRKITGSQFKSWERDFKNRTEAMRVVRIDRKQRSHDEDSGFTTLDKFLPNNIKMHDIVVETEQAIDKVKQIASQFLSEEEKFVLQNRFLCEDRQKDYTWIAKQLGCGVDRVKLMEQKIISKIKTLMKKDKSHE